MSSVKNPPLVLELTDRKPSSFVMEGTESFAEPERLDVSSIYILLNDSIVNVPSKTKGEPPTQRKTRWISGCDTIFVDEQVKQNIQFNPLRDVIVFAQGKLRVEREGDTVGLYDFLKSYDGNQNNPNRPSNMPIYFKEIDTAVEAEESFADIADEVKAMTYLSSLATTVKAVGGGPKTTEYDKEGIDWTCKLFNITTGDSYAEKLAGLIAKARHNPELFNNIIEDAASDIKVVIKTAKDLHVINLDSDKATFVEDGSLICNLRSKSMNDKINEFADYLRSADGEIQNSAIRTKTEYAKEKASKIK